MTKSNKSKNGSQRPTVSTSQGGNPVIVAGCRTPFAKAWGKFKRVPARYLARRAMLETLLQANVPGNEVDEVILGNVAGPADAPNITRVVATDIGIPDSVPAMTVHRNCASAMEAVALASDRIKAGQSKCVLAGGVESMSRVPFLFSDRAQEWFTRLGRARSMSERIGLLKRFRPSLLKPEPGLLKGLIDPSCGLSMGQTAEKLAKEFGISRAEQDEFAAQSHQRAIAAVEKQKEEIAPVFSPPDYQCYLDQDDGPRTDSTLERLARLKTVFDRRDGTVTAGNSSQISDGAATLLVMGEEQAKEKGYPILGKIRGHAAVGLDPSRMGLGPVFATAAVLEKTGIKFSDIDLFEINEAFAAQVLAVQRAMSSRSFCQDFAGLPDAVGDLDFDRVNVNGGAIALGHPVGASGARIIHTLLLEMQRRDVNIGLATLCVGGGQGQALVVER